MLVAVLGLLGARRARPAWRVEATTDGLEQRDWFVQGFGAADRACDEIARAACNTASTAPITPSDHRVRCHKGNGEGKRGEVFQMPTRFPIAIRVG
ncbi:MAG: hypothetical protein R2705_21770 [Ilumatobacteraceae bacterium]